MTLASPNAIPIQVRQPSMPVRGPSPNGATHDRSTFPGWGPKL